MKQKMTKKKRKGKRNVKQNEFSNVSITNIVIIYKVSCTYPKPISFLTRISR